MRICYIAYSCSPYGGSEEAIGWNLPYAMARFADVTVITKEEQRAAIEDFGRKAGLPETLSFHFCDIPPAYKRLFKGSLYSARLKPWIKRAAEIAGALHREDPFDILHQVTPVEFRALGSFDPPGCALFAGPLGGGEYAPASLRRYMAGDLPTETLRRAVNASTIKGFRRKLRSFNLVAFANEETRGLVGADDAADGRYPIMADVGVPAQEAREAIGKSRDRSNGWAPGFHDPIRLLYVGRLIPRKGVELLLDACAILKRDAFPFELRIYGEGSLGPRLRKRVDELGLQEVVGFEGKVPHTEIRNAYEWSDLVVFPSVRETGGTVIAEALTHLRPVVAFRQFGAAALLEGSSLLVDPASGAEGFADAIERATGPTSEDLRWMEAKIRQLDWDAKARTWFEAYAGLVSS